MTACVLGIGTIQNFLSSASWSWGQRKTDVVNMKQVALPVAELLLPVGDSGTSPKGLCTQGPPKAPYLDIV